MSLKSIRTSYSKLLSAITGAGIKLTESQKSDLDSFVMAIESTMSRQREVAIRQTKKIVESKMEREYKKVFEGIMDAMRENAELASKIQEKAIQLHESRKIASKVNDYLDLYVESVLPKKTIVDYEKMKKLERIHESLRDALVVSEDAIQDKMRQLEESYKVKQSKCETQVAKAQAKLNESMKKSMQLKREVESFKAQQLLESKVKDLPAYEARKVRKQLSEATAPEIEKKFDKTLESVRKGMKTEAKEEEVTLESEIEDILTKEDDMLKDRHHNGHKPVKECDGAEKEVKEDDDKFETLEEVNMTDDGDVELAESDVIDAADMQMWCNLGRESY